MPHQKMPAVRAGGGKFLTRTTLLSGLAALSVFVSAGCVLAAEAEQGSGAFPALYEEEAGLPAHVVY
ncbi:MAG: hypothetical protein WBQ60_07320, partial [Asticcacaulis sp.]